MEQNTFFVIIASVFYLNLGSVVIQKDLFILYF